MYQYQMNCRNLNTSFIILQIIKFDSFNFVIMITLHTANKTSKDTAYRTEVKYKYTTDDF